MPCGYTIDSASRLVRSVAHGLLTYPELKEHQTSLMKDPNFDPTFNQLWDFTLVTNTPVTQEQVRELAIPSFFSPGSRRALIAPKVPVIFGMLRMWEIYVEIQTGREQTRIFSDIEAGLKWIEGFEAGAG